MADKIEIRSDGILNVPHQSIIPYIEGDGVGMDIWRDRIRNLGFWTQIKPGITQPFEGKLH